MRRLSRQRDHCFRVILSPLESVIASANQSVIAPSCETLRGDFSIDGDYTDIQMSESLDLRPLALTIFYLSFCRAGLLVALMTTMRTEI